MLFLVYVRYSVQKVKLIVSKPLLWITFNENIKFSISKNWNTTKDQLKKTFQYGQVGLLKSMSIYWSHTDQESSYLLSVASLASRLSCLLWTLWTLAKILVRSSCLILLSSGRAFDTWNTVKSWIYSILTLEASKHAKLSFCTKDDIKW